MRQRVAMFACFAGLQTDYRRIQYFERGSMPLRQPIIRDGVYDRIYEYSCR